MKREVLITIDGDIGRETAEGTYDYRSETHYLSYVLKDTENEGHMVHTLLTISRERMSMVRKTVHEESGRTVARLKMEVPRSGEGSAIYHTPYGDMELISRGKTFESPAEELADGLIAEFHYELYGAGDSLPAVINRLKIMVK